MPNKAWIDEKGNWMLEKWGHCYKYHADHIVQRLEAEKAELMEVLEMVKKLDYKRWNDVRVVIHVANKILQKHKGK